MGAVRVAVGARAAAVASAHRAERPGLLSLQRQAGNRAVAAALAHPTVQRQLKVTGAGNDVTAMLGLLQAASGLTLTFDKKTHLVTVTGTSGQKVLSKALATQLQAIIDDPSQDAEINLGRTQSGVHIGAFPSDFATNPVQEVRIDQVVALEKGAPGEGTAKLAHEIIENFDMHAHRQESFNDAFTASHEPAVVAENHVLGEIEAAKGLSPSGDRHNQYTVEVSAIPGKKTKAKADRVLDIEVHDNSYLVFESRISGNGAFTAHRADKVSDGTFTATGFSPASDALPPQARADFPAVAAALDRDPTASVVIRPHVTAAVTAHRAEMWGFEVQEEIRGLITDTIKASDHRFDLVTADSGPADTVDILLSHPKL